MPRTITIDPVTRIEGHSKITIHVDDHGVVTDARFHTTQFRGFEKLCEGRPFYEMPSLMARTCGICPVSHLIASSKACDQILAVKIPPAAEKLRRIINLAQIIQSHALSFFHLSSPDFLLGLDFDPARRNLFGVLEANPQAARDGIAMRKFGQRIIEMLGGKRIHPAWVVPGGVNEPLTGERRTAILAMIPEAYEIAERTLAWFEPMVERHREEILTFANFPTMFLALVNDRGQLDFYDGGLRFVDAAGNIVADHVPPAEYAEHIAEAVEPWTFMKFPYHQAFGYPQGIYRVGPLARLNVISAMGTPRADDAWRRMMQDERGPVLSSFHYHWARLIEILAGVERIERLLRDPEILSRHVRAHAEPNRHEGIGISEAPRGTLIHHYWVDDEGLVTRVNLIIATGHNNLAMNRGILQAAKHYLDGRKITEGALNRVEAVIRAFDPCLSCSTHAAGQMALDVSLVGPGGEIIDRVQRD